ncbi:DUF4176 domain-containing protein [Metabacillus malikii]|uniref:DUF4176 domain-containing protein n=1 Tax=Metabacillus malikii TaxID=1504265 RepID=A0ABT9ZLH1_9BACI|nr:DUF4176 domain-containing protein [Metabacillus malikii]MDQ0233139.1 hypothetical protein [Metabacillus malikii]
MDYQDMNNRSDIDLLPIGTVVKLRNVKKLVMIYGKDQIQRRTQEKYHYVSVPFPEGNITEDYNLFFNHNMIERIVYRGLEM